jgi:hypothetical protein
MTIDNRFLSRARLVCYGPGSQLPGVGDGGDGGDNAPKFTQEDLNKILAEDRRKHQAQITRIQQTLEETAAAKGLEAQQREQLAQRLEEIEASQRTKEQQAAHERAQAEKAQAAKVEAAAKESQKWREKFQQQLVESRLAEAVSDGDIFSPAQVKQLLKSGVALEPVKDPVTGQFTENQEVVVTFEDRDDTGNPVTSKMDPRSAVARMKKLTAVYGNLFKAGVVSGVGSSSAVGGAFGGPGGTGLDPAKLSAAQYMEVRAKNPELLGLRRKKAGQPSGIAK